MGAKWGHYTSPNSNWILVHLFIVNDKACPRLLLVKAATTISNPPLPLKKETNGGAAYCLSIV